MTKKSSISWTSRIVAILLVTVVAVSSWAACAPAPAPSSQAPVELSGTINEAGSTSVQPLAELLAAGFHKANPKVTINISGGGTGAGVKAAAAGTVDLGAASRDLTMSEPDLIPFCIARDGVAIVVNKDNPVTKLTLEQVAKIYAGDITNWKDVGGNDATIVVVSREEGSGTRDGFQTFVTNPFGKKIKPDALFFDSNGAIRTKVSSEKNAVGYVSFGYMEGLKGLSLNDVTPTIENAQSGKYPVTRRLYLLTKTVPTGIVKAFIDYCRGAEAQKIAQAEGYIPLAK
jgi:phosphate transport system substrate-binding protein